MLANIINEDVAGTCDSIILKLGKLNELEHMDLLSQIGTYKYELEKSIQSNNNLLEFLRRIALPNSRFQGKILGSVEEAKSFLEKHVEGLLKATKCPLFPKSSETETSDLSGFHSCTSKTPVLSSITPTTTDDRLSNISDANTEITIVQSPRSTIFSNNNENISLEKSDELKNLHDLVEPISGQVEIQIMKLSSVMDNNQRSRVGTEDEVSLGSSSNSMALGWFDLYIEY